MARAIKKNAIRRLNLRLTEDEYAEILRMMARVKMTNASSFIRHRIFSKTFRVVTTNADELRYDGDLARLSLELKAIGVNLNQLTREVNSYHSEAMTRRLMSSIIGAIEDIHKLGGSIVRYINHREKLRRELNKGEDDSRDYQSE